MWSKPAFYVLLAGVWTLLIALAMLLETSPRTPNNDDKQKLTRAWQEAHCPPEARENLAEISIPGDRIADVEILDVLGERMFLPREWTTTTRYFKGPSTDGMSANTGGAGIIRPWRGPSPENNCRGLAYVSSSGDRANDPRFSLYLTFPRYSTESEDGSFDTQKGEYPNEHQVIEFVFFGPENGDPSLWYNQPSVNEHEEPTEILDDGWGAAVGNYGRVAFDMRDVASRRSDYRAVEVPGGWVLIVPVTEQIRAKVTLGPNVPVKSWRTYGEKAKQIYRWLTTKPRHREKLPPSL